MAKIAFIGLGVMGFPMARHLAVKAGQEGRGYNRTAANADAWTASHGGRPAPTPREAAAAQAFVFTPASAMTTTCAP